MQKSQSSKLQQILNSVVFRSWRPQPTVLSTVLTYLGFGVLLIIFSIVLFTTNNLAKVIIISNYGETCKSTLHSSTTCSISVEVLSNMPGPVYVLYELTNFYQSHKKYFSSKSNYQLAGGQIGDAEAQHSCDPVVYNKDLLVNKSWGGVALDPNAVASPCGLIAKSYFNDSFVLQNSSGTLSISSNGISWPKDQGMKYRRGPNSSSVQWIDPESQQFIVWMRTAALPTFRKLYGKIQNGLDKGNYTLSITNNYDMGLYDGEKSIILTTAVNGVARNTFSAVVTLIYGLICIGGAGFFLYRQKITQGQFGPKNLKDQ